MIIEEEHEPTIDSIWNVVTAVYRLGSRFVFILFSARKAGTCRVWDYESSHNWTFCVGVEKCIGFWIGMAATL
jgi:hypothetical protein